MKEIEAFENIKRQLLQISWVDVYQKALLDMLISVDPWGINVEKRNIEALVINMLKNSEDLLSIRDMLKNLNNIPFPESFRRSLWDALDDSRSYPLKDGEIRTILGELIGVDERGNKYIFKFNSNNTDLKVEKITTERIEYKEGDTILTHMWAGIVDTVSNSKITVALDEGDTLLEIDNNQFTQLTQLPSWRSDKSKEDLRKRNKDRDLWLSNELIDKIFNNVTYSKKEWMYQINGHSFVKSEFKMEDIIAFKENDSEPLSSREKSIIKDFESQGKELPEWLSQKKGEEEYEIEKGSKVKKFEELSWLTYVGAKKVCEILSSLAQSLEIKLEAPIEVGYISDMLSWKRKRTDQEDVNWNYNYNQQMNKLSTIFRAVTGFGLFVPFSINDKVTICLLSLGIPSEKWRTPLDAKDKDFHIDWIFG